MEQTIQDAIALLQKHDYKVLRPHVQRKMYHEIGEFEKPETLYEGKVVDCDANGTAKDAKPFEFGCVTFMYDTNGHIYSVDDVFTMFEDIGEPILEDVKK